MFPFDVARPKMLRILAGMDQKDRCSGIYMAGIACDKAPHAVFSSLVGRPRMLGILAGTDLKYICSGMYKAGFLVFLHLALCCPRHTGKMDYVGSGVYFLRPLVSGSHLFKLLPEKYSVAYFREMTPGMVSVFSTLLGSTADTCLASVYAASEEFHPFLREGRTFGS